ncbi:hypothetical protein MASR2M48_03080 [Spirochaetota bacterium]|jgi:hypothetical protein
MLGMPHVIHYEDDFFIVDGLVRVISDATRLEPDPEIVGDMLMAAVRLADTTLRRIKDLILANEHLVDRPDYLRLLSRTTRSFADSLSDMIRQDKPMGQMCSSSSDELERIIKAHRAAASELRDVLSSTINDDVPSEDQVSGDELSELLRL